MSEKRILVVDDEWAILDVVQAYLEKEGFQVITAASGTDALDKAAQLRPDMISQGIGEERPGLLLRPGADYIDRRNGANLE